MLAQVHRAEHEHNDADRYVDEEDPTPRKVLRKEATEHRGAGRSQSDGQDHQPRDPCAPRGREGAKKHCSASRREHAATNTLQDTRDDQLAEALRTAA